MRRCDDCGTDTANLNPYCHHPPEWTAGRHIVSETSYTVVTLSDAAAPVDIPSLMYGNGWQAAASVYQVRNWARGIADAAWAATRPAEAWGTDD